MKDRGIYKLAFWSFVGLLITIFVLALVSCNKDNDLIVDKEFTNNITQTITELRFNGQNSGITIEGIDKSGSLTGKAGPDSLIMSQSPLIEFKYNIINDVEYSINYTTNVVGDTIAIDTLSSTVISRDTLSIETGPIWMQFEERNTVDLLVGLNTPAIVDTLEVEIEIVVIDDVPSTSGLLFTAFGDGVNDPTLAASPSVIINNTRYVVVDSVPRFNPVGNIVRYTGGIEIPNFVARQFQIDPNTTFLQRRFLLTMTSSSGSVIVNEFAINFCDQQTYINRQCWLSGDPTCQDLF